MSLRMVYIFISNPGRPRSLAVDESEFGMSPACRAYHGHCPWGSITWATAMAPGSGQSPRHTSGGNRVRGNSPGWKRPGTSGDPDPGIRSCGQRGCRAGLSDLRGGMRSSSLWMIAPQVRGMSGSPFLLLTFRSSGIPAFPSGPGPQCPTLVEPGCGPGRNYLGQQLALLFPG